MKWPGPALMLVTEPSDRLEEIVDQAVAGGVNVVQLRDKSASAGELLEMIRRIRPITVSRALLLVNGNVDVAKEGGASGVHLPEHCGSILEARRTLGRKAYIGRSVHSLDAAVQAEMDGADYVIAGTTFASKSHLDEPPAGIEFLRVICGALSIPVLAIGGVMPWNAGYCVACGAAGVAVLSPIMRAEEPCAIAKKFRSEMQRTWPIPHRRVTTTTR